MRNLILLLFCLFGFYASSQSLQQLYAASKKSYADKDFALFLKQSKTLDSLRPSHPAFTYNLAVAYAANNRKDESLAVLKKAVLMNNKIDFETAEEFSAMLESPEFKQLIALKSQLNQTIVSSKKKVSLSEKDLHPEGLVYLSKAKLWLASSIHKHKIVSFDVMTGICTDWLNDADILAVFAIKADKDEKYLWVATSAMPEMLGFNAEMDGKSEILKVEIATKKIVKRYKATGKHVFGDIALSPKGGVFISDSAGAAIYTIKNEQLQVWLDLEKHAFNLQGITFNADFTQMYIADYLKGILSVPMKTPQRFKWLDFPEGTTYKGIDGLVFYKNALIAVHNGVNPIRTVRYSLDKDRISSYSVLDHNRPELDEPALAIVKDNELLFFANSPWKAYDKTFRLNLEAVENPILFVCELGQ